MSKSVSIEEFLELLDASIEEHKNTNDPIPEISKQRLGKIQGCLLTPFMTFDGNDLYDTIWDKAAILLYSINKGHNLSNGNKRMAYVVTEYFLFKNGINATLSNDKVYELSVNVAKSKTDDKDEIVEYIKTTLQNNNKMTKKDYEIKIAAAKSNKALNDKQREQIVAMYEKKIAELEPAKKPEPKASAKKTEPKAPAKKVEPKAAPVKAEPKKESKKIDYDCDDLIAKAKKAKAAAKERAKGPQKSEVTKSKETIEKVHDKVQKNVEAGKFGKAQLQKLITETEELLTFLKKTLKSL